MNNLNDLNNRVWAELTVGDEVAIERTVTSRDLYLFAHASGNLNPMHMPHLHVTDTNNAMVVAPSMWLGSLISSALGNILPGPGTTYRKQNLDFVERAKLGDVLTITIKLVEKQVSPVVVFTTEVREASGRLIATGVAEVNAPLEKKSLRQDALPALLLSEHNHFDQLVVAAQKCAPMPTAVVCPDDSNSLGGALLAMRAQLIVPLLIGSKSAIHRAADETSEDISDIELIDIADHRQAAAKAVELANQLKVRAIMKGNVHSDEILAQVVKRMVDCVVHDAFRMFLS